MLLRIPELLFLINFICILFSSETGECELSPSTARHILPHATDVASICWGLCSSSGPNTPNLKGLQYRNATFLYRILILPTVDSPWIFRISASNYPNFFFAAIMILFS